MLRKIGSLALLLVISQFLFAQEETVSVDMRPNGSIGNVYYSSSALTVSFSFDGSVPASADFFNPNVKKNKGFSAYSNHRDFKDYTIKGADSGTRTFTIAINLPANLDGQKTVVQFRFQDNSSRVDLSRNVSFIYRKPRLFLFSAGQQYLNTNKRLSQQADTIFRSLTRNPYIEERFSVYNPITVSLDENYAGLKKKMDSFSYMESRPSDVVLIYLKGHGKMNGKQFSYLTADGRTVSDENIVQMISPFINNHTSVFLFLDACYAGGLGNRLSTLSGNIAPVHFYMGADALTEKKDDGRFASRLSQALSERTVTSSSINKALFPKSAAGSGGYVCYPKMEEFVLCDNEPAAAYYEEKSVKGIGPMLMSLAPGVGQMYKKEYLKGGLMMAGTFAGIGGIILCESQRQTYAAQVTQTHDINVIRQLQANQQNMLVARNVLIGVTALVYVYNLVDAAVAPGNRRVQVTGNGIAFAF